MHFATFLPALLGLAAAVPYNDVANSPEGAIEAAARWFGKRDNPKTTSTSPGCKTTPATACTSQPTGYGPTASPDTVPNFKNHGQISKMAAQADTPKNFTQVFQNEDGSVNANQYITYFNLQSYDTNACAAKCNQITGCVAFNLYLERNPTLSTDPLCCPNPPSMTNIKCALWGSTLDSKSATNKGQWRNSFQVVMGGSNGYNRVKTTSSSRPAGTSSTSSSSKSSSAAISTTSSTPSSKSASPTSSSTTSSPTPTTSEKVQDSSSSSSAQSSIATADKGPAAKDPQVGSTSSSASQPTADLSVAPTASADSSTQSSSDPTTSSDMPSSTDDASSSTSKTYLSNTDQVQPMTGTDPGSPVTATAQTASASTGCATPVATPAINFNLNKTTVAGENIFMYGNIDQLGNWSVEKSKALTSYILKDGSNRTNWYGTIEVAAGTAFEYKYFQRNPDYSISWAKDPNYQYTVPSGCENLIVQSDQWPGTQDGTS